MKQIVYQHPCKPLLRDMVIALRSAYRFSGYEFKIEEVKNDANDYLFSQLYFETETKASYTLLTEMKAFCKGFELAILTKGGYGATASEEK